MQLGAEPCNVHGKHITFTPPCVARMLTSGLFMLVTHEWVTCVILPGICENSEGVPQ